MNESSRRQFITSSLAAGAALTSSHSLAIEPLKRINPRIKGLSLATYSLRPKMQWSRGKKQPDGTLSMMDFLEYCAKQGFDAAELTAYFFATPVSARTMNNLKRRAHLLGLDISGGAIGNDFGHPPKSDFGREQLDYTKQWIDGYADLGAPAIRIFAGRSRPEGATDEQAIANVIANLEAILPHAEKRGVMLGIENHDFAANIGVLETILHSVDSEWLGVTWDSANVAKTDDPYADLARIAPYAITAQIKVMTRIQDEPVEADLPKLIKILKDASYAGYLVLEYEEEEDAYNAIPKFKRDVEDAMSKVS